MRMAPGLSGNTGLRPHSIPRTATGPVGEHVQLEAKYVMGFRPCQSICMAPGLSSNTGYGRIASHVRQMAPIDDGTGPVRVPVWLDAKYTTGFRPHQCICMAPAPLHYVCSEKNCLLNATAFSAFHSSGYRLPVLWRITYDKLFFITMFISSTVLTKPHPSNLPWLVHPVGRSAEVAETGLAPPRLAPSSLLVLWLLGAVYVARPSQSP